MELWPFGNPVTLTFDPWSWKVLFSEILFSHVSCLGTLRRKDIRFHVWCEINDPIQIWPSHCFLTYSEQGKRKNQKEGKILIGLMR